MASPSSLPGYSTQIGEEEEEPADSGEWPRFLGSFLTEGICMTRLRPGEVMFGEELKLKLSSTGGGGGSGAASGSGGGGGGGGSKKSPKPSARPNPFAKSAAAASTIVRFTSAGGSEVGRLLPELAECVSTLLATSRAEFSLHSALPDDMGLGIQVCGTHT